MPDQYTHADSLAVYCSGAASDGASQSDQASCLGNYRSSTRNTDLDNVVTSPIANITVVFVSGANGVGAGTLTATTANDLTWTPPGGTVGAAVTIANGETKLIEGSNPDKYIVVTRTSATSLTGTATVTLSVSMSNVVGMTDAGSAESISGSVKYRCIMLKNVSAMAISDLKAHIKPIGTQRVSGTAQLGASGAGTITVATGDFADWADSGFCRIETSADAIREVAYYSSRTSTSLTVPAAGRGLLGTSAGAGAATDKIYCVSGLRIAKDANYPAQTIVNETTAPTGVTWSTQENAADGIAIGTVAAGDTVGLWVERTVVAGSTASLESIGSIGYSFSAS